MFRFPLRSQTIVDSYVKLLEAKRLKKINILKFLSHTKIVGTEKYCFKFTSYSLTTELRSVRLDQGLGQKLWMRTDFYFMCDQGKRL